MLDTKRLIVGLSLAAACSACRVGVNYPDPVSPRYAGSPRVLQVAPESDTLRVVSFNIRYALETVRAAQLLKTSPALRNAHVIFLQEMTAPATRYVAESLGMYFVYYPAIYNRIFRRDVGNAILSRYPLSSDAKLILPSRSRYAKTQRIATAATLTLKGRPVRLYSTHFGTPLDLGWEGRVAQLQHILDDASRHDLVVIGGDVNDKDIGKIAREEGYLWPTDTIPASNEFGRLDHFFVRGFELVRPRGAGTQRVSREVSDHNAIWIQVRMP